MDLSKWLQRGRQKRTIAQVLLKPMTPSHILVKAQRFNPHIQLRDIWRLLGQFERQGLAFCINPKQVTGKLYFLTDLGRAAVKAAFGQEVAPLPENIDWDAYARVVRAKVRKLVVIELGKPCGPARARTTSEIRKNLLPGNPIGLNQAIRAVKELQQQKLIRDAGTTVEGSRKLYQLTPLGRRVVEELKRSPNGSEPPEDDMKRIASSI